MKKYVFLIVLAALTAFSCTVSEQTRQSRAEKKALLAQTIRQQVDERQYEIIVRQAFPLGGTPIMLTTPYSLTIIGDSINSYLPYFGRAWNVPYGGGKALNFTGHIREYYSTWVSDQQVRIAIIVENDEDIYQYDVEVFLNSSAYINVSCRNRQTIGFSGEMRGER